MGTIWQGAAILMLASLINRFLSFIYRMMIIRLIGPEAMGLYEMVFPFYSLVLMIATAGVPVALAKLTAERAALQAWEKVRSIFRFSLLFLSASGLMAAITLWGLAPYLTGKVFADSRVYQTFMVMLLALPVVCICSCFRGYFQGLQLMRPVALAQVSEQIVRVASGLFFGLYLLPYGVAMAAAGLAIGMVMGEGIGLLISVLIFWLTRSLPKPEAETRSSYWAELNPLVRLSLPVMLARVTAGALITLEALIIPRQLQVGGLSVAEATTAYGQFAGIAFTLVYLPMVITVALSMAMVPAIAEAQAKKDFTLLTKRCHQALKVTIITGLPFAVIFYLLAGPLCSVIFATTAAAMALKMLAVGCIFIYLEQTLVGILNGLGAVRAVLLTTIAGGVVDFLGIYFFTPVWGIGGAAMAVNLGCATTALLDLFVLVRHTRLGFNVRSYIYMPALAVGCMVMGVSSLWFALQVLPETWRLLFTLLGSGLLYFLILLGNGVIAPLHFYLIMVRPKKS
ncbi:MAG: polysaccharide biosynthesis protein [Clostridia bacterium]|nr:polysaccharide biosynthesis protein [Clostridia bacterium]